MESAKLMYFKIEMSAKEFTVSNFEFYNYMSGSFHFSFFVIVSCHFQAKYGFFRTADFFVFGHFDQKTKNEEWNEPDNGLLII